MATNNSLISRTFSEGGKEWQVVMIGRQCHLLHRTKSGPYAAPVPVATYIKGDYLSYARQMRGFHGAWPTYLDFDRGVSHCRCWHQGPGLIMCLWPQLGLMIIDGSFVPAIVNTITTTTLRHRRRISHGRLPQRKTTELPPWWYHWWEDRGTRWSGPCKKRNHHLTSPFSPCFSSSPP